MTDRFRPALAAYVFGVLGVFLAVAPWTQLWDHHTFFLTGSAMGAWVRSGWVRGLVTGIGVLDLLVARGEVAALWRLLRVAEKEAAR